jgi:hypothetical protein
MAADVMRSFDVELDVQVEPTASLGDRLLTELGGQLEDPAVGEQAGAGLVTVAAGVAAADPVAASLRAAGVVDEALTRIGVTHRQFVGLRAILVGTGVAAA